MTFAPLWLNAGLVILGLMGLLFIVTYRLRRVCGVALLEKTLKDSKPGYVEYMANTPAFFPRLLPR